MVDMEENDDLSIFIVFNKTTGVYRSLQSNDVIAKDEDIRCV